MTHNHPNDGRLRSTCPACLISLIFKYEPVQPAAETATATKSNQHIKGFRAAPVVWNETPISFVHAEDDEGDARTDITGTEMGNKPTVRAEREAERASSVYAEELAYVEWLLELAATGVNMSRVSMLAHLHEEHVGYKMPRRTVLRLTQMAHGLLHELGVGHSDNPEHMVSPFSVELWKSRRRHLAQKRDSEYARQRRHARHLDRQEAARAQREQVLVDSARQLQSAIDHAAGTIVPRIDMRQFAHPVIIGVGTKAPLSLATAQIEVAGGVFSGIGTALCRPGDAWNTEVGRKLSLGRALRCLGTAIEMSGQHADAELSKRDTT